MSDRPTGARPSRLVAVLGPTNTGKTHLAVERMLGHASGMIGLPLRLLAREIYDRIVKARGPRQVALITGEEKIVPPHAAYFVCTVEAMPLTREVEFLAIDEIQLCADPSRGHVFTHRLLHARGKHETMLMGSGTMAPLIRQLLPHAEFMTRERFSSLTYAGSKKLTRLPKRSAVVAFSAEKVYAIAELIRRQRGGAAVVMGSLSPRTRNAQVALYQSGEVDFLVATDAVGMGLNMDVDHVAFAGVTKFDGKRSRWLHPQEVGQIAGRAGRYRTDGTFGVTGDAPELDEDLVAMVENHQFEPVQSAEWRSADLDFGSLKGLVKSLAAPPTYEGLKLAEEALDEKTLRKMAEDPLVERRTRNRADLRRLWEVCQTPDFRKTALDDHLRLVGEVFDHLTSRDRRLPEDWVSGHFDALDRVDGDIDALAQRLAGVRTLTYIANRPDWLRDPGHWQAKTRALEDRLSDTLHERLMQRFIDRRTSVLMRALSVREDVLAGVDAEGQVTVEGQYVGRLRGLAFDPAQGASALEDKALRAAAQHAVGPEIAKRLGQLAADADKAFGLLPDGTVLWNGHAAGVLSGGRPFAPRVRLFGELGSEPARERAARRLEAFVAGYASRKLGPLKRLEAAVAGGELRGLARGLAYRLLESSGVIDRAAVAQDVAALSQSERRALKTLGIKFGHFSLYLPALATPAARRVLSAFAAVEGQVWTGPRDAPSRLGEVPPSPAALAAHGLRACGPWAAPVEGLEQLDAVLRELPSTAGGSTLPADAAVKLGWTDEALRGVLRALGYIPGGKGPEAGQTVWRRKVLKPAPAKPGPTHSPFAALAALRPAAPEPRAQPPSRAKRRRPRRKAAAS
jgi:ATP-dependent RNA helicase SUPV3L1/SUV3